MEIEIKEKNENALLSRTEISASVSFTGATPSNVEIQKQLASKLSKDENLIIVKQIMTGFGETKAEITAFVYDSREAIEKIEQKPKKKQGDKKPEEKKEEKPAETKEEKNKEEKQEKKKEPAKEEKKE